MRSRGYSYTNFVAFCNPKSLAFELRLQTSQSSLFVQPATTTKPSSFRAR
jgi:hypothetical protein